jgi:NAD(P)-dependent dehydrogenase (short-subunit alcohol dehydrogenase family)
MTPQETPVWFITGCSSGFGRELAQQVLARGARVVVSARNAAQLQDLVRGHEARALSLSLDVTDAQQVAAAVQAAEAHFGRIDVLVNNAGYGYQASIEEGVADQVRAVFDVNVFGLVTMTQAVLPGMRARRRGHVINITSVAGLIGFAGSGFYAATKFAVEGLSDALAAEVGPLGIHVSCVEPGPFRTDFAGRSLRQTLPQVADYEATAGVRMKGIAATSGQQSGDPVRGCAAIIHITEVADPPRHLVLGAMGIGAVRGKAQRLLADIERWQSLSESTDFPAA